MNLRSYVHAVQDVYKRLAEPCAQSGLLRLRTSPEFKVVRSYGHHFPDDRFDNLCHVIAAGPSTTFAFDFDFEDSSGFSGNRGSPPVLQMAFQYSTVVTTSGSAADGASGSGHADSADSNGRSQQKGSGRPRYADLLIIYWQMGIPCPVETV